MPKMSKYEARRRAEAYGISFNRDFFTLSSSDVSYLVGLAGKVGYYKPKNANGSRGRYFYAYLQRG